MAATPKSLPPGDSERNEIQPQLVRITNHGKMNNWVTFALEFLEANEGRPIVLHTLPAPPPVPAGGAQELDSAAERRPGHRPGSTSTATTTIPRLISVVEIIKREYVKNLEAKHSSRLSGLHQYNEIGCLEDLGLVDSLPTQPDARANELAMALAGKNHVKQKQTPYMKITLCQSALPDLVERGATYQRPTVRKLSKSAKARAKRRERKSRGAEEITGSTSADPDADDSMVPA